ncbi:MAG: DUF4397 domain-containing protein [Muribaculaceae bacterium]|nr:DUF4397 domain-containing protein [Muribaculaceae bacterium]
MKYFKYIALLLLVAVTMGSCDKKEVSYMAEPVDESTKAYIQVGYYEPVTAGAANYMYYVDINGVEYGNDGATFLATFNTVPSGTNRYYAVDAGQVNIKLHKRVSDGSGGYNYPVVYDQNVTVEAGKRYCLYVHDLNKAPIPIEMTPAPEFGKALDTDSLCRVHFVNLLYEADGQPYTGKVQFGVQNLDSKEYEPVGKPVAFGESTDWFTVKIRKTVYNSSGSQRREVCLFAVDNSGKVTGKLPYTLANGNQGEFTDYWTWYIGRAYRQIAAGNCGSKTIRCTLYQFVIE